MQNCDCFGCKPGLIPVGYKENVCSVCEIPLGEYPAIQFMGSVCVKCLDNDHLTEDPVYKVKFPKCSCGKIVHPYNFLYHGVFQPLEGHHVESTAMPDFRLGLDKAKKARGL